MCFFLIAGSLDLVLSKTMTKKKSYELFSATFPHSLFKCGTTSAAESPQPHGNHCFDSNSRLGDGSMPTN